MTEREEALAAIRGHIDQFGHHIYLVAGAATPRYAYSIGASPNAGVEIIMAGDSFYMSEEAVFVINRIIKELREGRDWKTAKFEFGEDGTFSLRSVANSWVERLAAGALDYFKVPMIKALQIVPEARCTTVDSPDLSREWSAELEPPWQWLSRPWPYSVPEDSTAVTNLEALRGMPVNECMRWKEDQWELFSGVGENVKPSEIRIVPLGTLLSVDPSLEVVTNIAVGHGLWRGSKEQQWQKWNC